MKGAFTSVQSNLLHSPRRECSHFRASPWDVTQSCCASHWDTTQHPRHPSPPLSRPWDATRCCCSLQRVTLIPPLRLSWLTTQRCRCLHASSWHGTRCRHPLHVLPWCMGHDTTSPSPLRVALGRDTMSPLPSVCHPSPFVPLLARDTRLCVALGYGPHPHFLKHIMSLIFP
jgi:hypothetical protein